MDAPTITGFRRALGMMQGLGDTKEILDVPISQEIANAIVDPRTYADVPLLDSIFATLRKSDPFGLAQPTGHDPFWVVTRNADVAEIERRAADFVNGAKSITLLAKDAIAFAQAISGEENLIRSLVSVDGEEHKALRAITFPAFTPKEIKQLEAVVRTIAKEFVDHMFDLGPYCDFAADVAFHYPLRVIMTLLGVPQEDEAHLLTLTQQLFGSADPDKNRSGKQSTPVEAMEGMAQVMRDLEAYFADVTRRCRARPEPNINSLIANARIDGEYLSQRQLTGYYIIAATAGHDTTASTTASAMAVLAERPDILCQLKEDSSAIIPFVEEAIRWSSPVKSFMRTATLDTEVNGHVVQKGDWMMLSYHSANRDEATFDEPHIFKIDRKPNKHIAFGSGPHVCIGQHLARFEMRLFWEELLPRLAKVELAKPVSMVQSVFVSGPKSVPIHFSS